MHNESKSRTIKLNVNSEIFAIYFVRSLIHSRIWENQENWQISQRPYKIIKVEVQHRPWRQPAWDIKKKEITIDLAPFSTRQKPSGAEGLSKDSHTMFH